MWNRLFHGRGSSLLATMTVSAVTLYIIASIVIMRLLGTYSLLVIVAVILLPLLVYFFFSDGSQLVLAYLALLPIIQHLSTHAVIEAGDFFVTPHMVFQLLILIVAMNSFIHTYDGRKNRQLNDLDKSLLLFVVLTFFSLIYGYALPVNHEKRWLLFYTGIFETSTFYAIVVYLVSRREDLTRKILIAFAISSFSAALVAFQELNQVGYSFVDIFVARMRIGFGFHNTNLFGIYSAILFPVVFYSIVSPKFRRYRLVLGLSFILLTGLSLLCFNRGTFIVLAVELFLLYFIRENRKVIHWFMFLMLSIVVYFNHFLLFYLFRFFGGEASAATPYLDTSALYRYEAWKVGLKLLYLYPFGVGAGGFQYVWQIYGRFPTLYLGTPHELFLSIGVDYGVLAMITFIVMLVIAFIYSDKLSKEASGNPDFEFFKYVKVSIVGFIIYGMLTDGELSHLSGFITPNNGYTLSLFALLAVISVYSRKYLHGTTQA
ncbi:MAG: O-antigen ligase family protein [Bacteroidota bacterium]